MAVAYDLVLEDRILLARGRTQAQAAVRAGSRRDGAARRRLPSRARSSRSARRFRSATYDPESRRDLVDARARVHDDDRPAATRCCRRRWSPSAMRPPITRARADRAARRAARRARAPPAPTSPCTSGRQAVDEGVDAARRRAACSSRNGSAFACATASCCATTRARSSISLTRPTQDHALMLDALPKAPFPSSPAVRRLKRLASRYGMRRPAASRAASSPARRSREAIDAARAARAAAARR